MKRLGIVSLFLLLISSWNTNTYALSCAEPTKNAIDDYDAVVLGTVVNTKTTMRSELTKTVQLKVNRSWKTKTDAFITFQADSTWSLAYDKGENYVVYLKKTNGVYQDPLCSPSTEWNDSTDLSVLGKEVYVHDQTEPYPSLFSFYRFETLFLFSGIVLFSTLVIVFKRKKDSP